VVDATVAIIKSSEATSGWKRSLGKKYWAGQMLYDDEEDENQVSSCWDGVKVLFAKVSVLINVASS